MDTHPFRKFCPVCKLPNNINASVCQHCKTPFNTDNKEITDPPTTQQVGNSFGLTEELKEQVTKAHTPPPRGMLLFLLKGGEPIALRMEAEFVLGRGGDMSPEPLLDLTEYEAFALGVSRRHAMIKAVEDKYELTDLNSSNGTWLDGERLMPHRPHDLPSGGVIQLGRMQLVVIYAHPPRSKNV